MAPEKYIRSETKANELWQKILDQKYPDAREKVRIMPGYSTGASFGKNDFSATPDHWVIRKQKINPAWQKLDSYILIYGTSILPSALYSIKCPNKHLWKQAKLRKIIGHIIKHETGILIKNQDWNSAGIDDTEPSGKHSKRFTIHNDLTWSTTS